MDLLLGDLLVPDVAGDGRVGAVVGAHLANLPLVGAAADDVGAGLGCEPHPADARARAVAAAMAAKAEVLMDARLVGEPDGSVSGRSEHVLARAGPVIHPPPAAVPPST